MVIKLKNSSTDLYREIEQKSPRKIYTKVEALYVVLTCFTTHCLSCIALETGGRSPLGNVVTKSAAFNALFRRTYNLKIIMPVTNVITGLITTLMMIMGDRYGLPYLHLPWLVNTMKGIALCEGPALFSLANILLPNVTFPAGSFILATFLLYVVELCIWNDAFVNFLRCWKDYHYRKQCTATKIKEKLFAACNKKLLRQGDADNELSVALEKLKAQRSPVEIRNNVNSRISVESSVRHIKSTVEGNSNFLRNQISDVTG